MDASGPRARHRGMFIHVETPELDQLDQESAEGVSVRIGGSRKPTHAVRTTSSQVSEASEKTDRVSSTSLRLANGTGSHRPARTTR
jgi:hypothetical protein